MKEIVLRIKDEERNLRKAKEFLKQQRNYLEGDGRLNGEFSVNLNHQQNMVVRSIRV